MSRGPIVYGTCPACEVPVPLRWDGTTASHPEKDSLLECRGSYFAALRPDEVQR